MLLGAEPEQDFPDRIRMRAGLDAVPFVVAVGAFTDDAAARADVFLPTSVWGEKAGSTTNLEGRVQRMARLITPEGTTMDDWRIAQELATRFDADFGFETVDDVQDEIARVAPSFAGVDAELVRRARDGAVLPIAEFPDEIVLVDAGGFDVGVSWEPIRPAGDDRSQPTPSLAPTTPAGRRPKRPTTTTPSRGRSTGRRAPALHVWDRTVDAAGAARRPTRTVSASWPPARSTTPDASSRRARRSPSSPPAPRWSCTRATSAASA